MDFPGFRNILNEHFDMMVQDQNFLFRVDVDPDEMWSLYLASFPEGSNPIFRERTEHDCSCCRHFIRQFGNVVALLPDGQMISLWSFDPGDDVYSVVVDHLAQLVNAAPISDVLVTKEKFYGTEYSLEQMDDHVHRWSHFHIPVPERMRDKSRNTVESLEAEWRDSKHVLKRGLDEISPDAVDTVLELHAEKLLYKGEEWANALTVFRNLQDEYSAIPENERDDFCWRAATDVGHVIARLRNKSIGTLLMDITNDVNIDTALRNWGNMVDPLNYMHPKKKIHSKAEIANAEQFAAENGYLDSLPRRFATLADVTVNNVLWANRDAERHMGGASSMFDVLREDVVVDPNRLRDVQAISIEDFITDVLPHSSTFEVLFENRHTNQLVSITTASVHGAALMFKWDNPFAWVYNGNVTDSLKQQVAAAGGKVDGQLRFSIRWNHLRDYNRNDFDAHCIEPSGFHIYYSQMRSRHSGGNLDVDIVSPSRDVPAVENITYPYGKKLDNGKYEFFVRNFSHNGGRTGFDAEIEFNGALWQFSYPHELRNKEDVPVADLYIMNDQFRIDTHIDSSQSSIEVWGMNTNQWQPVSAVMYSPNYWDGQGVGHRHYMFMIPGCTNDTRPSGFHLEYLESGFRKHRKVFETLIQKTRVDDAPYQLSGLGFSNTERNNLIVKVDGRPFNIVF